MIGRILTSVAAVLVVGCSSDERGVQGPGSETSGFSARVVDADGRAVPGVAVRAVALDRSWQEFAAQSRDPVVGRGVSDSAGVVRFGLVAGVRRVALEIGDSDRAGRVELEAEAGASGRLAIETGAGLRIAAQVPGEVVGGVGLAGTGYTAMRDASGAWVFRGVAAGRYTAVALTDSGMALLGRIELGSGGTLDTALSADADSVLLEDFAFAPVRNRYGGLLGAGWWYTTTDSGYGGKSTVAPSDPSAALVPCADGNCLEMAFRIDTASSANFALVGLDLDRSYDAAGAVRLADLSKVVALRFHALGRGSVAVQIHYGSPGAYATCASEVVLDSNWSAREVRMDAMACDAPSSKAPAKAIGITFLAQKDLDLRLGRIVLVGAGPRSVFPALQLGGSP